MTIVSELAEYQALAADARLTHPAHSLFERVEEKQLEWLSASDLNLSAFDLAVLPRNYFTDMYGNILNYGPNGDQVMKLWRIIEDGLHQNNSTLDDENIQRFFFQFHSELGSLRANLAREASSVDYDLLNRLRGVSGVLSARKAFLWRRESSLYALICAVGFAKTIPAETPGYRIIQDLKPATDKFMELGKGKVQNA